MTPTGLADGFGQGSCPALAAMDTRALHPGTAVGPRSWRRLAAVAHGSAASVGVVCVRRLGGPADAGRTVSSAQQPRIPGHGTVTTVTDGDGRWRVAPRRAL